MPVFLYLLGPDSKHINGQALDARAEAAPDTVSVGAALAARFSILRGKPRKPMVPMLRVGATEGRCVICVCGRCL